MYWRTIRDYEVVGSEEGAFLYPDPLFLPKLLYISLLHLRYMPLQPSVCNMLTTVFLLFLLIFRSIALNFDWEREQLTVAEAATNDVIRFGNSLGTTATPNGCRVIPGDSEWPSEDDWATFNETLGGALLKPKPPASVCYTGEDYSAAKCEQLRKSWTGMNLQ